jgi:type I restriction enzyme S subunit
VTEIRAQKECSGFFLSLDIKNKMPNSRVTIPKDWKKVSLEKECWFERGMEPGADAYNTEGVGEPFIRVVDVTESRENSIFVDGIVTGKRVKKDDILLTLDGTIGAVRKGLEGIYSTGVRKVSFRENKNSNSLLYHLLQSEEIQHTIDVYASGSTIKHASSAIPYLFTSIPESLKEQEKISNVLNLVDETIDKTRVLIKKYESIFSGMAQDFFQYGIDENGTLRSKKSYKPKNTKYGAIPKEWELKQLKDVAKISDGTHQGVSFVSDGIPFLFVSCVRDGEIKWANAEKISAKLYKTISKGKEPRKGMILYTVVGSYGHAALIEDDRPFAFQRHIAYILPEKTKINPNFLAFWLSSNVAKSFAEVVALGNAQKTITLGDLGTFPVFLPKKEEQDRISSALSQVSHSISVEKKYLDKLLRQKAGLMRDLLSGAVRVKGLIEK